MAPTLRSRTLSHLHIQAEGPEHAPALMFAHALGTDLHLWDLQAAHFARAWRVIRFDFIGHGHSKDLHTLPSNLEDLTAQVVLALDALAVERACFVGTSMGAVIGLAAAARFPQRFSRLVLCGAHLQRDGRGAEDLRHRAEQIRHAGMGAVGASMMERWFPPGSAQLPEELRRSVEAMLLRTSPEAYAACALALARYDLVPALAALELPVLLISGELDHGVEQHFAGIAQGMPHMRTVVIPGVGHFPNLQAPEKFNALLDAFLSS